jgi:hypothetical protein
VKLRISAALTLAATAVPAIAGPPYLTDDPVPTDTGHWEIYGFATGEHLSSTLDADAGFDLNYGPVKGVQLTATVPLSFSHESFEGWRGGSGDLELAVKYRFIDDDKSGFSVAVFPRVILPTSGIESDEKTRLLLPLWMEKDFGGGTSLFGGGGYEINSGPGNRNFLQAAAALTHDVSDKVSIGGELAWQQPEEAGGTNEVRAGVGSIVKLSTHYELLFSGGPTWADHRTGYHFYVALGLLF